ncbi:MAG: GldG family protein, partial [Limisphaerales bacterium]
MNSKKVETFFFSTLGVIAAFAILVAINLIFSSVRSGRFDLTEDKVYTLSEGTRAILKKLDTPVTIRYYYTQDDDVNVPAFIKNYARRVEDLLHEYQTLAPKFIKLEKLDPQPDTDAEDSANLDGIDGQMLQTGDRLFHGVSFTCLDQKENITFLAPQRERLLEYDVSRAISRVMVAEKPTIGVISALPLFGTPASPQMMRMGQFQGAPAWMAIN